MSEFVHLHVHSEYSLLESALRIDHLIADAVKYGMPAIAITDTNALYGAVKFTRKALAAGVRPILGVQLSVGKQRSDAKSGAAKEECDTAVFLARDFTGYQHLVALVTAAHQNSRFPHVTFAELSNHCEGVFALIAGGESAPLRLFAEHQSEAAERWLGEWLKAWPKEQLYVDLQDHALPEERAGLPAVVKWARQHGIPLVATNDVHYRTREDAQVQKTLQMIEGNSPNLLMGDRYELASPEEMERRFSKIPEAVSNAAELASQCRVELPLSRTLLPKYPASEGESASEVLRRAAFAGAKQRFGVVEGEVLERLEYELSVIAKLGFSDYFLVVADFIRFAHKQGISTGPGRGSAAGSLVSYSLRITDVDPIKHHLTFERFLNPERVSWPDIDTDFEYERRGEVIAYVTEKYGRNFVAQIGTFGTLAAKASIRDAGRALKVDPLLIDKVARMVPSYPGVSLESAAQESKSIQEILDADERARELWNAAASIEGLPRHTSVHAAGVVISPIPLDTLVPVQPGGDGTPVTQFPMEDIEALGLIKMDFLGLRTLTLIDRTVKSVEDGGGTRIDWRRIPDDNQQTYGMLSRGESDGCFQLESSGMKRVLREYKPTCSEDLIALISLYRPGPMENIPTFVASRHGKIKPQYLHPDLVPILQDTYGVIVYQEQIMQIAVVMAGFTMGEADLLRRAMGKKQREVMERERARFVSGCVSRGYDEDVANDVYDLIARFADYGFNRAHAAAYAVLAYRTAYLRANHLPHFLASLLTMHMGQTDKMAEYGRDAKRHGISLLPPSVNRSHLAFTVEGEAGIRTGLLAIRNVGPSAVEAVLGAREGGEFTSMVDFLSRVNQRVCNRKAVESLLAAGALDQFLPDGTSSTVRLQLLDEAYLALEQGSPTAGLFGSDSGHKAPETLYIRLAVEARSRETMGQIRRLLLTSRGDVRVALFDPSLHRTRLLDEKYAVKVTPELISALEEVVGIGNARLGKSAVRM